MATYRVYFDAVSHYSGVMEIEADSEEAAQDTANWTPVPVHEILPEHVTDFLITAIESDDEAEDDAEPGIDADPDVFLAYWHQGKTEAHWSSPNGCHERCPMLSCQQGRGDA